MNDQWSELEKLARAATPGDRVWGSWEILDEDRAAQARNEPYWSLHPTGDSIELSIGPFGRKALTPDRLLWAEGRETDGIGAYSQEDMDFIAASNPQVILQLIAIARSEAMLRDAVFGATMHGCVKGDCPHSSEKECFGYLMDIITDNLSDALAESDRLRDIGAGEGL